jgi:hypothetical protein
MMSNPHLGCDKFICFHCGRPFAGNGGKHLKFVTGTSWVYVCGDCLDRMVGLTAEEEALMDSQEAGA